MSHKNGRENIGSDFPSVDILYTLCGRKAQNILRDHHHTVSFPVQSEGIKVQPKTSLASEHQHPQGMVLQQLFSQLQSDHLLEEISNHEIHNVVI